MIWLLLCFYVHLSSSLTKTGGPPVRLALAPPKPGRWGWGMGRAFISTTRNRPSSVRVGALCSSPRRGQTRDQLLTYDPRRALRTSGPVSEATQTDPSLLGPRWDPIQLAKCGWIAMQPGQSVRTWVQRSLGSPHLVVITATSNMRPGRSPRNMGAGPTLDGRDREGHKSLHSESGVLPHVSSC